MIPSWSFLVYLTRALQDVWLTSRLITVGLARRYLSLYGSLSWRGKFLCLLGWCQFKKVGVGDQMTNSNWTTRLLLLNMLYIECSMYLKWSLYVLASEEPWKAGCFSDATNDTFVLSSNNGNKSVYICNLLYYYILTTKIYFHSSAPNSHQCL